MSAPYSLLTEGKRYPSRLLLEPRAHRLVAMSSSPGDPPLATWIPRKPRLCFHEERPGHAALLAGLPGVLAGALAQPWHSPGAVQAPFQGQTPAGAPTLQAPPPFQLPALNGTCSSSPTKQVQGPRPPDPEDPRVCSSFPQDSSH